MKKYNYHERFNQALAHRKITTISQLVDCVRRRAAGDHEVADILNGLIHVIEPPGCQMGHCEKHTAYGFCNCGDGLEPSKCKKHREYIARRDKRIQDAYLLGREAQKKRDKTPPFANDYHRNRAWVKGWTDEVERKPVRNMKTGKFDIRHEVPTAETIGEFYISTDNNLLCFISRFLELETADNIRRIAWICREVGDEDRREAITVSSRYWKDGIPCLKIVDGFPLDRMAEIHAEIEQKTKLLLTRGDRNAEN